MHGRRLKRMRRARAQHRHELCQCGVGSIALLERQPCLRGTKRMGLRTSTLASCTATCECFSRNRCAQSAGTVLWRASQRRVGDPGSDDQLLL